MDESLGYEAFYRGAQQAAHKAMEDHGRADYDGFALHAGVAVEKLAKALLVSKNPIYIAEMRGSAEILFHLGGHRKSDKVRTIGASEAIGRLRMLDVLPVNRQLDLLIDLRNGVAHTSSTEQSKALLPVLAQTVESLILESDGSLADFWGRWTETSVAAIDQRRTQIERDVLVRVRQARHRFEDRFTGLPEGAKEKVLDAPHVGFDRMMVTNPTTSGGGRTIAFSVHSVTCPACKGAASVTLSPRSESPSSAILFLDAFTCRYCGLKLDTEEEILASGADVDAASLSHQVKAMLGFTSGYASYIGGSPAS